MRLIDADKLIASLKPKESVWVGLVLAEQVANAETVKAVPVEWIKQYWDAHRVDNMTIWNMLNAWEKENEESLAE